MVAGRQKSSFRGSTSSESGSSESGSSDDEIKQVKASALAKERGKELCDEFGEKIADNSDEADAKELGVQEDQKWGRWRSNSSAVSLSSSTSSRGSSDSERVREFHGRQLPRSSGAGKHKKEGLFGEESLALRQASIEGFLDYTSSPDALDLAHADVHLSTSDSSLEVNTDLLPNVTDIFDATIIIGPEPEPGITPESQSNPDSDFHSEAELEPKLGAEPKPQSESDSEREAEPKQNQKQKQKRKQNVKEDCLFHISSEEDTSGYREAKEDEEKGDRGGVENALDGIVGKQSPDGVANADQLRKSSRSKSYALPQLPMPATGRPRIKSLIGHFDRLARMSESQGDSQCESQDSGRFPRPRHPKARPAGSDASGTATVSAAASAAASVFTLKESSNDLSSGASEASRSSRVAFPRKRGTAADDLQARRSRAMESRAESRSDNDSFATTDSETSHSVGTSEVPASAGPASFKAGPKQALLAWNGSKAPPEALLLHHSPKYTAPRRATMGLNSTYSHATLATSQVPARTAIAAPRIAAPNNAQAIVSQGSKDGGLRDSQIRDVATSRSAASRSSHSGLTTSFPAQLEDLTSVAPLPFYASDSTSISKSSPELSSNSPSSPPHSSRRPSQHSQHSQHSRHSRHSLHSGQSSKEVESRARPQKKVDVRSLTKDENQHDGSKPEKAIKSFNLGTPFDKRRRSSSSEQTSHRSLTPSLQSHLSHHSRYSHLSHHSHHSHHSSRRSGKELEDAARHHLRHDEPRSSRCSSHRVSHRSDRRSSHLSRHRSDSEERQDRGISRRESGQVEQKPSAEIRDRLSAQAPAWLYDDATVVGVPSLDDSSVAPSTQRPNRRSDRTSLAPGKAVGGGALVAPETSAIEGDKKANLNQEYINQGYIDQGQIDQELTEQEDIPESSRKGDSSIVSPSYKTAIHLSSAIAPPLAPHPVLSSVLPQVLPPVSSLSHRSVHSSRLSHARGSDTEIIENLENMSIRSPHDEVSLSSAPSSEEHVDDPSFNSANPENFHTRDLLSPDAPTHATVARFEDNFWVKKLPATQLFPSNSVHMSFSYTSSSFEIEICVDRSRFFMDPLPTPVPAYSLDQRTERSRTLLGSKLGLITEHFDVTDGNASDDEQRTILGRRSLLGSQRGVYNEVEEMGRGGMEGGWEVVPSEKVPVVKAAFKSCLRLFSYHDAFVASHTDAAIKSEPAGSQQPDTAAETRLNCAAEALCLVLLDILPSLLLVPPEAVIPPSQAFPALSDAAPSDTGLHTRETPSLTERVFRTFFEKAAIERRPFSGWLGPSLPSEMPSTATDPCDTLLTFLSSTFCFNPQLLSLQHWPTLGLLSLSNLERQIYKVFALPTQEIYEQARQQERLKHLIDAFRSILTFTHFSHPGSRLTFDCYLANPATAKSALRFGAPALSHWAGGQSYSVVLEPHVRMPHEIVEQDHGSADVVYRANNVEFARVPAGPVPLQSLISAFHLLKTLTDTYPHTRLTPNIHANTEPAAFAVPHRAMSALPALPRSQGLALSPFSRTRMLQASQVWTLPPYEAPAPLVAFQST